MTRPYTPGNFQTESQRNQALHFTGIMDKQGFDTSTIQHTIDSRMVSVVFPCCGERQHLWKSNIRTSMFNCRNRECSHYRQPPTEQVRGFRDAGHVFPAYKPRNGVGAADGQRRTTYVTRKEFEDYNERIEATFDTIANILRNAGITPPRDASGDN